MTTRLVERLKKELTPQLQGYVAKTVGESPAATAKAVDTAIATLFSGVAAAADTPDGLATLLRLVSDPVNDGTLLNQLPALYQGTMTAAPIYRLGSQLLHQVFGGKLGTVNQSIATLAGVKPSAAAVLTTTLAPHVLAIIGRDQRASGDLSAAGLARLLAGESAEVSAERGAAAAMMAAATGVGAGTANASVSTVREAGFGQPASSETGSPSQGELSRNIPTAGEIVENGSGGATLPPGRRGKVTRPAGSGAWLIFPAGFALGAALLGLGAIISDQVQQWPSGSSQQRTVVAAADVAPPPVSPAPVAPAPVAPAPVAPAPVPPAQVKATVAPPSPAAAPLPAPGAKPAPPAATSNAPSTTPTTPPAKLAPQAASAAPSEAVPVAALAPSTPAVKPAATPIAAPAPVTTPPAEAAPPTAAPPTAAPAPSPAKAPEPAAEPRRKPGPPGTTSFFGRGPVADLGPATMNPNYKPTPAVAEVAPTLPPSSPSSPAPPVAAVAVVQTPPPLAPPSVPVAPATPTTQAPTVAPSPPTLRVSPPGTTTYFGSAPTPPDKPVVFNPDYKPVIVADVAATPPAAAATPIVPSAPAPVQKTVPAASQTPPPTAAPAARPATAPPSGTTSYFGTGPGGPPLPSVAINPGYKPAARSPLTSAAPSAPPSRGQDAAGATLDLAGCRTAVSTAVQSGPVRFETSSAKLTRASAATLDSVARAFKSCGTGKLKVEGHTDNRGAAEYNLNLSEARARSVVAYLTARGIDGARVASDGFGFAKPLVPNSSAASMAKNRRIDFIVE